MSLDQIWICPSLKCGEWFDLRYSERKREPIDETYGKYTVVLSKGCFREGEGYCFLREADARRFFQGGPLDPGEQSYREREGFDRVELYIQDKLIDSFSLEAGNLDAPQGTDLQAKQSGG
jgi:hypothetical protein